MHVWAVRDRRKKRRHFYWMSLLLGSVWIFAELQIVFEWTIIFTLTNTKQWLLSKNNVSRKLHLPLLTIFSAFQNGPKLCGIKFDNQSSSKDRRIVDCFFASVYVCASVCMCSPLISILRVFPVNHRRLSVKPLVCGYANVKTRFWQMHCFVCTRHILLSNGMPYFSNAAG